MAGKEPLVYIDGEYYPKGSAKISVYDHGLLYGDGVFEGIRAYNGIVFHLREHIERMLEGLRITRINSPLSKEELMNAVVETLRRNNFMDAYIRLIITRGRGNLGLDPRSSQKPSIIILSVLAKFQAIDAGTDEVVMLDHRGMVSEFHGSNMFLVKQGIVHTPTSASGILHGITRSRVLKLAEELGYDVHERDITPYELLNADEVFLTGTLAEVVPVIRIQGVPIGEGKPGPVTKEIIRAFQRITQDPKEGTVIREQVPVPARARTISRPT